MLGEEDGIWEESSPARVSVSSVLALGEVELVAGTAVLEDSLVDSMLGVDVEVDEIPGTDSGAGVFVTVCITVPGSDTDCVGCGSAGEAWLDNELCVSGGVAIAINLVTIAFYCFKNQGIYGELNLCPCHL